MRRVLLVALCGGAVLALLTPSVAGAQPGPRPASATVDPPATSRLWLVAGGGMATVRGDCQTCEVDAPYRNTGSVLVDVGYRVNSRMDVAADLFWVPLTASDGKLHAVHVNGVAQFRPWAGHGFFLKGGAGVALLTNWVDAVGPEPIAQRALSVVVGTGWAFRRDERVGWQVLFTQHAGAVGDLQTDSGSVPDVMGNFWSMGVGLVFR